MKPRNAFLPLMLTLLAAASHAQTQTSKPEDAKATGGMPAITAARCAYTPNDGECAAPNHPNDAAREPAANTTVAQIPRRMPRRPTPRHHAAYMGPYPSNWMSEGNTRGAVIGTLIGGGLGIALGIRVNTDNHAQAKVAAPLLIGGLGALLGAVAGGNWPAAPHWRHHHGWPDGDDEEAVASRSHALSQSAQDAPDRVAPQKPASPKLDAPELSGNARKSVPVLTALP